MYFSDMFSHLRKSSWTRKCSPISWANEQLQKEKCLEQDLPRRSSDDSGFRQSWRMTTTSSNNNNKKDPTNYNRITMIRMNNSKNSEGHLCGSHVLICFDMFWYVSMSYVAMLISERSRFHLAPLGLSWSLWRAAQRFESSQCEGGVEEQLCQLPFGHLNLTVCYGCYGKWMKMVH